MKKKMSIAVVLIVAMLVTGCASGDEGKSGPLGTEPTVINLGESNSVDYEKVKSTNLSDDAQKELTVRKYAEGAYVFTDDGKHYLAVFAGERNTGGYGIEIIEIILTNANLTASVEMMEPDPDMMVTEALTYPMDLVELKNIESIDNLTVSLELEGGGVSHINDDQTDEGHYISPTTDCAIGEIITVGDIVDFENQYIHIISGDLVEVFRYDVNQEREFYLGQSVQLIKGEKDNYLEPYLVEDFSVRHTNMGHLIDSVSGQVTEITDETITILSEEKEMSFIFYETSLVSVGDQVEAHYMNFGENSENSILALYREASKMEMIVREVHRTQKGELMLYTSGVESENVDYHVLIGGGTVVELNYSEIQPGDSIIVYADIILESYPAQVQANRVIQ